MTAKRKASSQLASETPTKRVTRSQQLTTPELRPDPPKIIRTIRPTVKTTYTRRSRRSIPVDTSLGSLKENGKRSDTPESEDELNLQPCQTRSGVRNSPAKRARPSAVSEQQVGGSEDDIPTPPPSPTKRPKIAKSSPIKRQRFESPKTRKTDSPAPDSESESADPSPARISEHHIALPIFSEPSSPNRDLHHHLNARKHEISCAIQYPPDPVDEDGFTLATNRPAFEQLSDLLEGTVARGEGNSCLVLGPRGSGKSRVVDGCISNLPERPIVLRLCGWSQQTDRLAMREIAYQLTRQTGKSFLSGDDAEEADTQELNEESNPFLDKPDSVPSLALPLSSHLPALISLLPTLDRPTIVVLDAFDLFAQHPRQSLLYCLLDTVQSCRAGVGGKGVAVIGMTTRVDIINLLEKRVKSRFSGRMLRTAAPSQSQGWVALARGILCSRIKDHMEEGGEWQQKWEAAIQSFLDDATTITLLNETFSVTKDVRVLTRLLTSVALKLSLTSPFPLSAGLISAVETQRARPRFSFLHTLPYPSMCLLIACIHTGTAGHPIFTFEMLWEKVRDQIRVSTSAPVQLNGGSIGMLKCTRPVLMSAFESLVSARIIVVTASPSASIAKEFVKFRAVVGKEDVKKAVDTRNDIILKKWLMKAT